MQKKNKIIPRNNDQYPILASTYVVKDTTGQLSEIAKNANNLYNASLYQLRQSWFKHHQFHNMNWLYHLFKKKLKNHENILYTKFPYQQTAQQTLKDVSEAWMDWRKTLKAFYKNPSKFTGRPGIPKYLDKGSRHIFHITSQNAKIKNGYLIINPRNHLINIKLKLDPQVKNLQRVTFKPMSKGYFKIIVQYKINNNDIVYLPDNHKYMGIDPGLDNAFTCVTNTGAYPLIINGKNVKAINQYYNKVSGQLSKKHAKYGQNYYLKQTKHGPIKNYYYSNAQQNITSWRNRHILEFAHQATKRIIDYALNNDVNTIVIGKNKGQKRSTSMGKRNNQNFVGIPHAQIINMLKYKANLHGISLICTNESYTSQTSFLDHEAPYWCNGNKARQKKGLSPVNRRIHRGLFKSNHGKLINADVNGALQIIKKVFPNTNFNNGIVDAVLHPVKWTVHI